MVLGRRSGPDESRRHGTVVWSGALTAAAKPPSFERKMWVAPGGQTGDTNTFGSFVKRSPSLMVTPTSPAGGRGATVRSIRATSVFPAASLTRTAGLSSRGVL